MADQLGIVNMSLGRLGTQASIASLDEASPEAFNAKLFWDQAVDACLAELDWRFASKQLALPLAGSPPVPWTFQYALPSDCIKVRRVVRAAPSGAASGIVTRTLGRVPYARGLGTDAVGNQVAVLWTDDPSGILDYTARVANPGLWEPGFVTTMTWRLASELAVAITGKGEIQSAMMQGWNEAIAAARLATAQEGVAIADHVPDWMAVRGLPFDGGQHGYGWR